MSNIKNIKKLILKIDTELHILDSIFLDNYKIWTDTPIKNILFTNNKKIMNEAIINLILCIKKYNKKILIKKIKSKTNNKDIIKLVDMCKKYKYLKK